MSFRRFKQHCKSVRSCKYSEHACNLLIGKQADLCNEKNCPVFKNCKRLQKGMTYNEFVNKYFPDLQKKKEIEYVI